MRDQLSSLLRDKYHLEDQRRDLGRQYRDDLTALESLNMPIQQREQQEAALNATYSQQAGTLCQRIEVYQHKIDICRAKLDNLGATIKLLKSLTNSSHCEESSLNISDPGFIDM
uniref:Uncharacterized protein n=1 Tax=Ditylenchus dipsaci TaxID=166011 RepID=A0A915CWM5_9BILA